MPRHTVVLFFYLSIALAGSQAEYVRVQGGELIAPDGTRLLLWGMNLGNWLVPEGYMFQWEQGPSSPREIQALINELVGPHEADRFWNGFREQYIREQDIQFLRRAGFNSVRIPFHYKVITDRSGFDLLDRVIGWCRRAGIWVVLDMHCAPCGQTGTNIDDSWGYPWLFEDAECQRRTTALWREIAEHYRSEPILLGYDLLNEPYLDFRDRYNVPIWLGESGENSNEWIAAFRAVLENNGIGWAFWPYKKMGPASCVLSFEKPAHWDEIVTYAKSPGFTGDAEKRIAKRPSIGDSQAALADLLKKIRFENCRINQAYIDSLLANRRISTQKN